MPRVRRSDSSAKKSSVLSPSEDDPPGTPPPQQRNAANARERARMRVLSRAFCRLKTTLPWVPADTKLSKLDTLRLATSYIAHLRDSLLSPAAAAAAAAAVAASTRQTMGPQSPPAQYTNGVMWPLNFQPNLPEPWLNRRTSVNGTLRNPTLGSHREPPCPATPLSLPSEHTSHGVPPSPPFSSGEDEEDSDDTETAVTQQWQMVRL